METENQSDGGKEPNGQTDVTDNLSLLELELPTDSLAAQMVSTYRGCDDPSSALTKILDERLDKLREEYAAPAPQDD
jgi:hypothetical protein